MTASASQLTSPYPEVLDESSHRLTDQAFEFLQIDPDAAAACVKRICLLGVPVGEFRYFLAELWQALEDDHMVDADVRFKGSSATFFSSSMKKYPGTKEERQELFLQENGRTLKLREVDEIEAKHDSIWGGNAPSQRPFDSMYRLGISPDKSDLDIQISSDIAFARAREIVERGGVSTDSIRFNDPSYNFLIKEIADVEFLYLHRWVNNWQEKLDRPINLAIFDSSGPPELIQELSSHFDQSDWVVKRDEA